MSESRDLGRRMANAVPTLQKKEKLLEAVQPASLIPTRRKVLEQILRGQTGEQRGDQKAWKITPGFYQKYILLDKLLS